MSLFGKKKTESSSAAAAGGKKTAPAAKAKKEEKVQSVEPKVELAKKETVKKTTAPKSAMKDLYQGQTAAEEAKKSEKSASKSGDAYRILVKPLITEKAANLGTENKYVFEVSENANKIQITSAVNEVYGIEPVSVNIISVKGKKVRYGRHFGQRKDTRKAIVTLPKGKTINIYEGV